MDEWVKSTAAEVAFWRDWLTKEEFRQARELRLHAPKCFLGTLLARIGYPLNPRVLDVGSGPISTLYAEAKREEIELTCSDALAKDYGALLAEAGINDVHPIVSVKGEDLTQVFLRDEFDLVHCGNALDHFEDPAKAFAQMFDVCKPGGAVVIKSIENEGKRENYCGMHQWNLRADDSGLWLSSRASEDINLFDLVPLSGFELRYVNSPTDSFRMFELLGFKKGEFDNPSVAVCLRSILARFSSIFGVSHRRPRADQAVVRSARRIRRHWHRS